MKKNALPVLIIVGLIIIMGIFLGVSALIEKYTPSKERQNLTEYYNIKEETQAAIILDNNISSEYITLINGEAYVDYSFVCDYLDSRFYWDSKENILLYATSTDLIMAKAESTSYTVGKTSNEFSKVVVKATAESALVHLDFISLFANISCEYFESPNRVVITSKWGEISTSTLKNDTAVRFEANIKSPILCDVAKASTLTVLETADNWTKVATSDGFIGYVESKNLTKATTQTLVSEKPEETFKHVLKNEPINLLWHQVGSASASKKAIASILSESKGVNVISPTWFKVSDNEGNVKSIASSDYVDYCHEHDVEVWALISDFEVDDVNIKEVLTRTSSRHNLVNQIVAKAVEYNLDGINIDFEAILDSVTGDAYIQFLRELAIKLHALDINLSTDVPSYGSTNNIVYQYGNQHNFVDYVIFMGYDQHYNQKSGEGPVASLEWTEDTIKNLLSEGVPSNQLVLGMPLFTKLWILTPKVEENSAEVTYVLTWQNIGLDLAKKWMSNHVPEPEWLEECGQYYGTCTEDGTIYKMWIEDATSIELRLKQMQKHSLAGAAFWKSEFANTTIWDTIIKYVN